MPACWTVLHETQIKGGKVCARQTEVLVSRKWDIYQFSGKTGSAEFAPSWVEVIKVEGLKIDAALYKNLLKQPASTNLTKPYIYILLH